MCTEENKEFSPEELNALIDAIRNGERPYIDIDEAECAFDLLIEKGDMDAAEVLTAHAVGIHPDAPEVLLIRASCLTDLSRFEESEKILRKVELIDDSYPDIYINLGWMRLKQNCIHESLDYFDKAVGMCEGVDDILIYEIAMNLNGLDYHTESIKYANTYLERHPDDEKALFEKAYALGKVGMIDESIEIYKGLTERTPFWSTVWYNMGIMLSIQERIEEALESFEMVTTIEPETPESYLHIANLYIALSDPEKALYNYVEYYSLVPRENLDKIVFRNMGECWERIGNKELAYRFLMLATMKKRDDDLSWYDLAYVANDLDRLTMAEMAIEEAIQCNPNEADYYFLKAQILIRQGIESPMSALMEGLKLNGAVLMAWIEIYKLSMCNMPFAQQMSSIEYLRTSFYNGPAMDVLEAYARFQQNHDDERVWELIKKAADADRDIIIDAIADTNISDLMQDVRTMRVLGKEYLETYAKFC